MTKKKMMIEKQQYHDQEESKGKEVELEHEEEIGKTFRMLTVEGKWEGVIAKCEKDIILCRTMINKSRGTALHVAVNEGNEAAVRGLVERIIGHKMEDALKLKDERGDTPLHLAAARGLKRICEYIIGENQERKELIKAVTDPESLSSGGKICETKI